MLLHYYYLLVFYCVSIWFVNFCFLPQRHLSVKVRGVHKKVSRLVLLPISNTPAQSSSSLYSQHSDCYSLGIGSLMFCFYIFLKELRDNKVLDQICIPQGTYFKTQQNVLDFCAWSNLAYSCLWISNWNWDLILIFL